MKKEITLEKLGFERQERQEIILDEKDDIIVYTNKLKYEICVTFNLNKKYFEIKLFNGERYISASCSPITLQAIYNECKKLGWFNEN